MKEWSWGLPAGVKQHGRGREKGARVKARVGARVKARVRVRPHCPRGGEITTRDTTKPRVRVRVRGQERFDTILDKYY